MVDLTSKLLSNVFIWSQICPQHVNKLIADSVYFVTHMLYHYVNKRSRTYVYVYGHVPAKCLNQMPTDIRAPADLVLKMFMKAMFTGCSRDLASEVLLLHASRPSRTGLHLIDKRCTINSYDIFRLKGSYTALNER